MKLPTLILDFDSTISSVEALEELALIRANESNNHKIIDEIKNITNSAMNGDLKFDIALEKRLGILNFSRYDLDVLVNILINKLSKSFLESFSEIKKYSNKIYIVSGGFTDFIKPVLDYNSINVDGIFANDFVFNKEGLCIGVNKKNPLSSENGKVKVLKTVELKNPIIVVGDGFTDYEIKKSKIADTFIAYTEFIKREKVISLSDYSADNFFKVLEFIK